jgi:hypothetical protein
MPPLGSGAEDRLVVTLRIYVQALVDQEFHDFEASPHGGLHEDRVAVLVLRIHVSTFGQQGFNLLQRSFLGCLQQLFIH